MLAAGDEGGAAAAYQQACAFYTTGRLELALRQFELCGQMLREALGLEPAAKPLRVAEEIREALLV